MDVGIRMDRLLKKELVWQMQVLKKICCLNFIYIFAFLKSRIQKQWRIYLRVFIFKGIKITKQIKSLFKSVLLHLRHCFFSCADLEKQTLKNTKEILAFHLSMVDKMNNNNKRRQSI